MLFLYRPRQTWLPYPSPRRGTQQSAYNRQLQEKFSATRRVPPSPPGSDTSPTSAPADEDSVWEGDVTARLRDLAQLHADGTLSDDEFAAAKARVLGTPPLAP
jgi:hypothetical protein